jgi:hypothetical protein
MFANTGFMAASTTVAPLNMLRAYPIFIPKTAVYDEAVLRVTAVAGAGGEVKLALYAADGVNQGPGTRLAITAAFNTNAASIVALSNVPFTAAPTLQAGWYWIAAVYGVASPTIRANSVTATGDNLQLGISPAATDFYINSYDTIGVEAAFAYADPPAAFPAYVEMTQNTALGRAIYALRMQ